MRIRNRKAARFQIGRLSCLVSAFLRGAVSMRHWRFAHTPSNLTSSAPETSLKHPIYRSNFWLMRTTANPEEACSTTALSHFR